MTRTKMRHAGLIAKILKKAPPHILLFNNPTGRVEVRKGSWVSYGFFKGGGDLVGINTIDRLGVFMTIEVKVGRDTLKPEQENFLKIISDRGGIAAVCRETDELDDIFSLKAGERYGF